MHDLTVLAIRRIMQINADRRRLLYNSIFESKVTICVGDEFD